jgi:hypothetical protein
MAITREKIREQNQRDIEYFKKFSVCVRQALDIQAHAVLEFVVEPEDSGDRSGAVKIEARSAL